MIDGADVRGGGEHILLVEDEEGLLTSGYVAHEVIQGDQPNGELAVLQKGWTLTDLTQRVREVLDRKRAP